MHLQKLKNIFTDSIVRERYMGWDYKSSKNKSCKINAKLKSMHKRTKTKSEKQLKSEMYLSTYVIDTCSIPMLYTKFKRISPNLPCSSYLCRTGSFSIKALLGFGLFWKSDNQSIIIDITRNPRESQSYCLFERDKHTHTRVSGTF